MLQNKYKYQLNKAPHVKWFLVKIPVMSVFIKYWLKVSLIPLRYGSCFRDPLLVQKLHQSIVVFLTFFIKFYLSNKFNKVKLVSSLSLLYIEEFAGNKSTLYNVKAVKDDFTCSNLFDKVFIKFFFFKKAFFLKFIIKSLLLVENSNYFKMSNLTKINMFSSLKGLYYLTNTKVFKSLTY